MSHRSTYNPTETDLKRLKSKGLIRDYHVTRIGKNLPPTISKEKEYLWKEISYWAHGKGLTVTPEYKFNPERRWRFDWAIMGTIEGKDIFIAVEYEGIFSEKSGHTTHKGYTKDADKYNSAAGLGWKVLRFTAANYTNALTELNKCI